MSKLALAAVAAFALVSPALASPALAASPTAQDLANREAPTQAISAQGVNFSDQAQVRAFYTRLQSAARQVCSAGGPYRPVAGTEDLTCVRRNVQEGVKAVNAPQLTALLDATYGPGASNSRAYAIDAR